MEDREKQKPTKPIRIWKELYEIITEISDKYRYIKSDLISAIVFEALKNESLLTTALVKWFEIPFEEAQDTALDIMNKIYSLESILSIAEDLEEKKTKEAVQIAQKTS